MVSPFSKISKKSKLFRSVLLLWLVFPSAAGYLLPSLYGKAGEHCAQAVALLPHFECSTAAVMAGLGDVLAQKQRASEKTPKPYQLSRTLKFMLKGLGEGIIWSIWYRRAEIWSVQLTAAIVGTAPNPALSRLVNTIISLILDFTVACPLIYALWDIPFPAVLNGVPPRQIPTQIRVKLRSMLLASFKIWTPVNVLIYNVPVQHRVVLMSVADVFWQSIVSSIVSTSGATVPQLAVEDVLGANAVKAGGPVNATATIFEHGLAGKPVPRIFPVS